MEFFALLSVIKTPVTILHILSVVVGMGAALSSDVLFAFYSKDKKLNPTELKTLTALSHMVLFGLIFIILTGTMLFLSNVPQYLVSVKFLVKMTIVVILLINGFILHTYIWKHLTRKGFLTLKREGFIRKVSFACGAISIISWIFILILGVLHSVSVTYSFLIALYLVVLMCGISTALLIEHKKFE